MTDSGVVKQFKDGEIPLASKALLLLLILFLVFLFFKDISLHIISSSSSPLSELYNS